MSLYCVVIPPSRTIIVASRIRLGWMWRDDDVLYTVTTPKCYKTPHNCLG